MARPIIKGLTDDPPPRKKPGRKPDGKERVTNVEHLTHKQRIFIQEYLIDQNASAAARRAGYSKVSAANASRDLLGHPVIKAEIDKRLAEKLMNANLSADMLLQKMHQMITGSVSDLFDDNGNLIHPTRLPEHIRPRIAGIKVRTDGKPYKRHENDDEYDQDHVIEIKLWNPDAQLTNLAKAFAMFSDRPAGNITITIVGCLPDDPIEWSQEPLSPDAMESSDKAKSE